MYHSEDNTSAGKTDNTVVKIRAGDVISESVVFTVNNDLHCYILCQELLVRLPTRDGREQQKAEGLRVPSNEDASLFCSFHRHND
ncbi:hypothetical protein AVEN_256222-1 [Araneus ventricosus]|uniref:Uncharacterized protein n=1 Tax=Araneus ventricosus TaxID=182803 RepID=A0A4Y2LPJ3_ARAVE|nr:hypothetical protein AVEN_256222-1 [Araneus ventricosus]